MRKLFVTLMLLVAALGANAKNAKTVYVTHGYVDGGSVDLSSALGNLKYDIDSLTIVGVLNENDFVVLRECCAKGKLTGIDMSRCLVFGGNIPNHAFCPTNINGAKSTRADADRNDYYTNLQYVKLPGGLKSIGDKAFFRTNIRELEIPRHVEQIGNEAFGDCEYLKSVTVRNFNPPVGGTEFGGCSDASLYVPVGSGEKYAAADGWKNFNVVESENSFITLTVNLDGNNTIKDVLGDKLYKADSLIITGRMQDDMENYETKNDFYALNGAAKMGLLTGVNMKDATNEIIPKNAFNRGFKFEDFNVDSYLHGSRLMYITLPDNLKRIEKYAFYQTPLQTIEFPATLTYIGTEAFANCTELHKIVLLEGLTCSDIQSFFQCQNVDYVYLPSTLESIGEVSLFLNHYFRPKQRSCAVYCNRFTPPYIIKDEDSEANGTDRGIFVDLLDEDEYNKNLLIDYTLYVPVGAKRNYETDPGDWKYFGTIIETPLLTGITDGIDSAVSTVADNGTTEVYTLDGRLVFKGAARPVLGKGLYIVKSGGEARKVLVK
ncbi:MAG: leucine-rich repeat protein [Prevotella sp.]|nr:leucine-rich repeat protein [Prevotella sp.]